MLTPTQQHTIQTILAPFEPTEIGVFGSYARGEQRADSDLDLLVTFGKRLTLLDLVGLEMELTEQLGIKVDLVTRNALSLFILPFVEKDLKMIA
jgi:hypothetical protein